MIDTHCHLDFVEFDHDRDQVIQRTKNVGVQRIVIPAVKYATWPTLLNVVRKHNSSDCNLDFVLGLHPVFLNEHKEEHLALLDEAIKKHQPQAVGEIGLDYYIKTLDKQAQQYYFEQQLIIAKEHKLPVIIHVRKAHDECLQYLHKHQLVGGVIHAFNGSIQQAHKYRELNFLLGFGGMLTYEKSRRLHALIKEVPDDCIVLETDAPDMTIASHHGERNSPEYIPKILQKAAELRQIEEAEFAKITSKNWQRVFPTPSN